MAPDYLLVQESVKDAFLKELLREIRTQCGEEPLSEKDYGHIINEKHFDRLCGLMREGEILIGGRTDAQALQIEPTVIDGITPESPIMQEEIFGPLFPVMTYRTSEDVVRTVRSMEKPLALYYFSMDPRKMDFIERHISYGGGCFNDTILHLASSTMPFGGAGESGMGSYHGKYGFDTFSHKKGIVRKTMKLDVNFRYRPYTDKKESMMKKFL